LLQLKKDFGNPYDLASWDPKTDCCEWYCVKCDDRKNIITTNRITDIFIDDGSLPGPIPASIGNIPFLERLRFTAQPKMMGPIPPAIVKLKNLNSLWIRSTNISGSVPNFLSQLTKLTYLNLAFNNLSGSIPSSLSTLPLEYLDFGRNKLTGSIPESFGEFKYKEFTLFLSHNQLSGKIPASLGKVDFARFDFSRNKLEGDASMLIGTTRKTTLWQVDLSRNLLAFDLSNVKLPETLRYLDLSHNKITGGIPQSWTTSTVLSGLNVSYNRLCGKIPVGGELKRFDSSSYIHNKCLCGSPLPPCK
jgi:Leucine-rich repeat (LRR) protein